MDFLSTVDLGLLVIVVGVLVVIAGFLLGWMILYLVRSQKTGSSPTPQAALPENLIMPPPATGKRVAKATEEEEAESPLREHFNALSEVGRRASATPVEALRLLRDRTTGALIVEVEAQRYRALKEIPDGRIGRQVLQAAADLVRFTEVLQPRAQEKPPQPPSIPAADAAPSASPPHPSPLALEVAPALEKEPSLPRTPAPPSVEREFLRSLVEQGQPEEDESQKLSLSPIEFFRRGFAARRAARLQSDAPSSRSFVEEIEEILQRFIRTYPSFIGKRVHVGTGPGGGIRIQVENEFYDTPDDIPDPEIRGIIKAAIQEWEKS